MEPMSLRSSVVQANARASTASHQGPGLGVMTAQTATQPGCGNCRFFSQRGASKAGVCRRYPPTVHIVGMRPNPMGGDPTPVISVYWPEVVSEVWCGEWATKLEEIDFSRLATAEGSG